MIQTEEIKCSISEIPFKTTLSFKYLIAELENNGKNPDHPLSDSANKILSELKKIPALTKPIIDETVLESNRELVKKLMSFVVSPASNSNLLCAATPPFTPKPFYASKLFNETMKGEHRKLQMAKDVQKDSMLIAIIYQAYFVILKKFYDTDVHIDIPFTFKLTDDSDRSVKYFKMLFNTSYTEIKARGDVNKISEEEIKELFDRATDLDFWNEKIPLKNFEFIGFILFSYTDITQEYVISQLKSDLLDKNSIFTREGFNKIKEKVRALVELPDMEFGLAAFSDFDSSFNQNMLWNTIIPQTELKCHEYKGTLYETAYKEKRIVLTNDFEKLEKDKVVSAFLKKGFRSHVIVPLMIDEEIVGMIEFSINKPGWLSLIKIRRFQELFPVFAVALKRSKEEWNDKIRSVIQEEFTAIHPTVSWRFVEAAAAMLDENRKVDRSKIEMITFPDVVPIYGATDIRNSTLERNRAIQSDLAQHLSLVKSILTVGKRDKEMPLLNIMSSKIELHMQKVNSGLKAGDEISILDFFRKEIEPVFHQLKLRDQSLAERVDNYFERMDPELGVLYNERKNFEQSLTRINDEVGEILDKEQVKAQQVFPHYFEKYHTDGVEYNAYLGQSLVKDLVFNDIYLQNIRLWQLLTMVKIARRVKGIQYELKTKLDVTQLILVQSNPLSIAFRQDEKKFDVDGAYNIRYEITKKRIDKAVVKSTKERVTQVGKIAIIYSLADEIDEYKNYINYMVSEGYIKNTFEYLELEDLQGASGLRALRVEIDFDYLPSMDEINLADINVALKTK